MHHETTKCLSFKELVKACGGKQGAIISGDDAYDGNGNGIEFDPDYDDDADCFCD